MATPSKAGLNHKRSTSSCNTSKKQVEDDKLKIQDIRKHDTCYDIQGLMNKPGTAARLVNVLENGNTIPCGGLKNAPGPLVWEAQKKRNLSRWPQESELSMPVPGRNLNEYLFIT